MAKEQVCKNHNIFSSIFTSHILPSSFHNNLSQKWQPSCQQSFFLDGSELWVRLRPMLQQVRLRWHRQCLCGDGCQAGPCYSSGSSSGGASVADTVAQAFFDGIINQAAGSCEGKHFYTRAAFLSGLNSYTGFGKDGSALESKP
ncbi:hypothetical protein PVL29_006857 [Vitis rotundifolia]|uniref:Uncharacterized protein n=1 Tax=Vitis rotundifolia TaxID=103349 RepID=A0AA39DYL7_VITRO|nr:hypothetical protein PVL29_006857 [Vitis rotundifolia]